jgi:hypothetical protein
MLIRLQLQNKYTNLRQIWHAYFFMPGRDHKRLKTPEKCSEFDCFYGRSLYFGNNARLKNDV